MLYFWMTRALYVSAGYNAVGALAFIFPESAPMMAGLPEAGHPLYTAIVVMTISLFGAGYLWQALTGERDRTFLTLAAAGKIGFFLVFLTSWALGTVPLGVVLATSGDLLLGAFFGVWLWRTRPVRVGAQRWGGSSRYEAGRAPQPLD